MNQKGFSRKSSLLKEIDFYLVTDSGLSKKGTLSNVREAVESGCRIVQYREKNKSTKEIIGQEDMPVETARKLLGEDKIIGLHDSYNGLIYDGSIYDGLIYNGSIYDGSIYVPHADLTLASYLKWTYRYDKPVQRFF